MPEGRRFAKTTNDLEAGRESRIVGVLLRPNLVKVGCRLTRFGLSSGKVLGTVQRIGSQRSGALLRADSATVPVGCQANRCASPTSWTSAGATLQSIYRFLGTDWQVQ